MMGWGAGYALQILYGLTFANGDQLQVAEKHKVDNTGLVSKHKYSRFRFFFSFFFCSRDLSTSSTRADVALALNYTARGRQSSLQIVYLSFL